MNIDYLLNRKTKRIDELVLKSTGDDDSAFLTRLLKALMYRDEITIEASETQVISFVSGDITAAKETL